MTCWGSKSNDNEKLLKKIRDNDESMKSLYLMPFRPFSKLIIIIVNNISYISFSSNYILINYR